MSSDELEWGKNLICSAALQTLTISGDEKVLFVCVVGQHVNLGFWGLIRADLCLKCYPELQQGQTGVVVSWDGQSVIMSSSCLCHSFLICVMQYNPKHYMAGFCETSKLCFGKNRTSLVIFKDWFFFLRKNYTSLSFDWPLPLLSSMSCHCISSSRDIGPIAGDRCKVINTIATSSPNWVSEDDTKFGYDSESVALLCSAALV